MTTSPCRLAVTVLLLLAGGCGSPEQAEDRESEPAATAESEARIEVETAQVEHATPLREPPPPPHPRPVGEWMEELRRAASPPLRQPGARVREVAAVLADAGFPDVRVHGGPRHVDVAESRIEVTEVEAGGLGGGDATVRVVLASAEDAATVEALFASRYEPFEAGGYYVRPYESGELTGVVSNLRGPDLRLVAWRNRHVIIESTGLDDAAIRRLDAVAGSGRLYGTPAVPAPPSKPPVPRPANESEKPPRSPKDGMKPTPRAPPAPDEPPDIPSLTATVEDMRFYEGGLDTVPVDRRRYATSFVAPDTRCVWWELALAHPAPGKRRDFVIKAAWYRSDGTVAWNQTVNSKLEASWTRSQHTFGRGAATKGSLTPDSYLVELEVDGRVVAAAEFDVLPGKHGAAIFYDVEIQHNHVVEGQKGMWVAFSLDLIGREHAETHIGLDPRFTTGKMLRDLNGLYADGAGNVAVIVSYKPEGEDSSWDDSIFLPYDELHLAKGHHQLRLQLRAYDPTLRVVVGSSAWLPFDITQD